MTSRILSKNSSNAFEGSSLLVPSRLNVEDLEDAKQKFFSPEKRTNLKEREFRARDIHLMYQRLSEELPIEDRCEKRLTIGHRFYRVDYISDSVVAEISRLPIAVISRPVINFASIHAKLFKLEMLRRVSGIKKDDRIYMLILVSPDAVGNPSLGNDIQQIVHEASLLDISVYPVSSYEAAARLIIDVEKPIVDAPLSEDDLLNLEEFEDNDPPSMRK